MLHTQDTTPPACASPDGARPSQPALTPVAGTQTGRVVADIDADWPLSEVIPTVVRVTFSDGLAAAYTTYLDTDERSSWAYCSAPWPTETSVEDDAVAEAAIGEAWRVRQEVA